MPPPLRLWTAQLMNRHVFCFVFFCRRTVVCPIIDVISDDTFEYMAGSDMTYGGFNWKLNFRWYPVPQREMDRRKGDRTLPVRWVIPRYCALESDTFASSFCFEVSFCWFLRPHRQMTLISLLSQLKTKFRLQRHNWVISKIPHSSQALTQANRTSKITFIPWASAWLIGLQNGCAQSNRTSPFNLPQLLFR